MDCTMPTAVVFLSSPLQAIFRAMKSEASISRRLTRKAFSVNAAVSTRALARTALCRGDQELLVVAQRLVELAGTLLVSHPSAVPDLVAAAGFALEGVVVVIPGVQGDWAYHVRSKAMPRTILITGSGTSPLLADRDEGLAYVCRGGVCSLPACSVDALDAQLREVRHSWLSLI